MPRIRRKQAVENIEAVVDENTIRLGWWPRYQSYCFVAGAAGRRYLRADEAKGIDEYVTPLSRRSADLFLRFARWPEDPGMDASLDTERNAEAAKLWADTFGLLGLNPPDTDWIEEDPLRRITARRLAPCGQVYVPPWQRKNSGLGGPPNETIENFALEAWEAHTILSLYEALNTPTRAGLETIREYMSNEEENGLLGRSYVERAVHGRDGDSSRRWAREIVTLGIEGKVKDACYPTVESYDHAGGGAKQGWGFDSLLGAMWLQMMWLVAEPPRICRWCGRALGGGRKDKRYCSDKCRGDWNYHESGKKSGKTHRKRVRLRNGR